MKRREFIRSVVSGSLVFTTGLLNRCDTKNKKPNILIIMSDQHGACFSSPYDHPNIKTPNLDWLANNGVLFENAYCNSPLCVPSRMSFMSGKYLKNNQVWDNGMILSSDIPTWPMALRDQGYDVVLAGKMHFLGPDQLHGFRAQLALDRGGPGPKLNWNDPDSGFGHWNFLDKTKRFGLPAGEGEITENDRLCEERAIKYIQSPERKKQPWAMVVGIFAPHRPWRVERRFLDLYPLEQLQAPEIPEDHLKNQHPAHKRSRYLHRMPPEGHPKPYSLQTILRNHQAYYGLVSRVDEQIGRILDALKQSGEMDNTVVVYTSDHGEMLGHHGHWMKSLFYEQSASVPLIISCPKKFKTQRVNQVVSLVDLTATILEIAGAEGSFQIDGDSLVPLLQGDTANWKDEAFAEHYATWTDRPVAMVRKGPYKLVAYYQELPELYDLEKDPGEFNNLADHPDYKDILKKLQNRLNELWDVQVLRRKVVQSQYNRYIFPKTSKEYQQLLEMGKKIRAAQS